MVALTLIGALLGQVRGGPTVGLTQREAFAAVQRTQTYSQLAFAMFLSAALITTAAIIVAVFTHWAD